MTGFGILGSANGLRSPFPAWFQIAPFEVTARTLHGVEAWTDVRGEATAG